MVDAGRPRVVDPVRPLVVIAGGETLAALGLAVAVAVSGFRAEAGIGSVAAEVVLWLVVVVALGFVWLALYRRRRLGLTPFLLTQAFGLVIAWTVGGSDLWGYRILGAVLAAAALSGLLTGLRSAVRQSLH